MPNPILPIIVASILLGVLAQKKKGRTGAGWALLAFVFQFVGYMFCVFVMGMTREPIGGMPGNLYALTDEGRFVAALTAIIFVGGVVLIAVLSLPKRVAAVVTVAEARSVEDLGGLSATTAPRDARLPCPSCAEAILPSAKVCPHCRRDLPNGWATEQKRAQDLAHFAHHRETT